MVSSKYSHRTHSHPTPHVCHPPPPPPPPPVSACEHFLLPASQTIYSYQSASGTIKVVCSDAGEEETYDVEWEMTWGSMDAKPEVISDDTEHQWTWDPYSQAGTCTLTAHVSRDGSPLFSPTCEIIVQSGCG